MITVLADDLSGAAEVAGACHARGLAAEVQIAPRPTSVEALCLDADTRSLSPDAAYERATQLIHALRSQPARLFTKVDSVLRGPVAAEIAGLLRASELPRALLVPANPARGRVVRAGQYFVNGLLLTETEFAHDPEHPARTADVADLLDHASGLPVSVIRPGEALPPAGIIVGEAASPEDLAHWAAHVDERTLPAGAAEFFNAWLEANRGPYPPAPFSPTAPLRGPWPASEGDTSNSDDVEPHLFSHPSRGDAEQEAGDEGGTRPPHTLIVSGSTSIAGRDFCRKCEARGAPVMRMPPELFAGAEGAVAEARWEAATRRALAKHLLVVVAIDQPHHPAHGWPARLRASLAGLVASVLAGSGVDRLYIEGGSTARAIVERLGWVRLRVCAQLAPGIVALRPVGVVTPLLILKPGSYSWPGSELAQFRSLGHSFPF